MRSLRAIKWMLTPRFGYIIQKKQNTSRVEWRIKDFTQKPNNENACFIKRLLYTWKLSHGVCRLIFIWITAFTAS